MIKLPDLAQKEDVFRLFREFSAFEVAPEMPLSRSAREAQLDQFRSWLSANGVRLDKLEIATVGSGMHGLVATELILPNEHVIHVPRSAMMTLQDAFESSVGALFGKDPKIVSSPSLLLALFLLSERATNQSKWKPYIDMLPKQFSNPFCFSATDYQPLEDCLITEEIVSIMRNLLIQYFYIGRVITEAPADQIPFPQFKFSDFLWAISVVMTRQNSIPSQDGASSILALIPGWDMCNHENGVQTSSFDVAKNCLEAYSARQVEEGDEYFMCYGRRSTSDLFLYAGFVPATNPYDYLKMQFKLNDKEDIYQRRLEVAHKLGFSQTQTIPVFPKPLTNAANQEIYFLLLVINASKDELEKVLQLPDGADLPVDLFSQSTIETCQKWLKIKLAVLSRKFKTSLEQDERAMQSCVEDASLQASLEYRVSERKLLATTLAALG